MEKFLTYLETYKTGLFVLMLLAFFIVLLFDWIMKILNLGKYKLTFRGSISSQSGQSGLLYLLGEFLAKIITDFRHFLAILLLAIFGVTLFITISGPGGNVENLSNTLQAVMSTLGTLIGSIIGYYYGESAARKANSSNSDGNNIRENIIQDGTDSPIDKAPDPNL